MAVVDRLGEHEVSCPRGVIDTVPHSDNIGTWGSLPYTWVSSTLPQALKFWFP